MSATVAGATVLVPNTRSARAIRRASEARMLPACKAWLTPDVLPFEAFVAHLYSNALIAGAVTRSVLQREQELQLWRQIIARSQAGRTILLPDSAAALASEAFRTAKEWDIALNAPLMNSSTDTRAFAAWSVEFERQLSIQGWTCAARLAGELPVALKDCSLPSHLFVFLPETTPAQRGFLQALRNAGVTVTLAPEYDGGESNLSRYEFNGVADELQASALWARRQLEAQPDCRVGVVLFDLARKLPQVESSFRSVLCPEHLLGGHSAAPFEIATPLPLSEYPAVRCALNLLRLFAGPVDFDTFAATLTSPYLAESSMAAAAFVTRVRERARLEVSLDDLAEWLRNSSLLPGLAAALERLPKHSSFQSEQSATYWADISRRILETLGWPGTVALNSEEFQCSNRWRELLVAISSLELLEWRTGFAGFVARLERMAAGQNFKPETLAAPVQIMDAAEAEGSVFDALWIGSCSDDLWPDTPKASPLLPVPLLKEAGFPVVGSAQSDVRVTRLTHRLLNSAPNVVLSLACRTDDEREQRWSPAFSGIAFASEIELPQPLAAGFEPATMETISDYVAPVLQTGEDVRGGTSLLQEQSNCPFQAFAVRRLLARQSEGPNEALAFTERGKVIERALQLIWDELKDSEGLQRLDVPFVIERAVEDAMAQELPPRRDPWTVRFRSLERNRTIEVLAEWLAIEARRAPFEVIEHQREVEMSLGGLRLRGRIDRLDKVGSAHVVIDYKTGRPESIRSWKVPRPRLPQLPFYAAVMRERQIDLAGIAFGVVRRGEAAFKGYLRAPDVLPCSSPRRDDFDGLPFDEYAPQWTSELERLATMFVNGAAQVDPKIAPGRNNSPCERCHLASLCRIGDLGIADADDDVEGGDDE